MQWILALMSQDQGQPIAAHRSPAVQLRGYTVYMTCLQVQENTVGQGTGPHQYTEAPVRPQHGAGFSTPAGHSRNMVSLHKIKAICWPAKRKQKKYGSHKKTKDTGLELKSYLR